MVFLISLIFSGELVFQKATTHNLNPVVVSAFSINKNDDVCIVSNRLSLLFGKIDALSHVNFPISKSHKIIWVESLKSFVLSDYQNNLVSFWDKNGSLLGKRNIYPEKYRDYLFLPENKVIRVKEDLNGPYTIQFLCEEKPVFSFKDNDNSRLREGTIVKRVNEPYSIWGNCESHIYCPRHAS
ncbi:MAG: hypothetical protein CSA81_02810 [Acidobacteria bacterium]|nr:MAG: hypothetical protein CSA81_02810 [Acidobacteriota bacterium]